MDNPVWLQEMGLMSDVTRARCPWQVQCDSQHGGDGGLCAASCHCLLALHCSWGTQCTPSPAGCVTHSAQCLTSLRMQLESNEGIWWWGRAGSHCQHHPALPGARVSWFLLEKESERCVCKQVPELAQEIWLTNIVLLWMVWWFAARSVPARLIILSASSWGIFKSCWLSDWFLWENYDISGNFIWGRMNAWLDAVRVNCRCCIKTPRWMKTCHSASLHSLPYFILPSTLNMQGPRVPSLQGRACSGQETFPFLFSGCFSGWVSGLQLLPVLLHQYFASATVFGWSCALLIPSSSVFPLPSKWNEARSDQSWWLIKNLLLALFKMFLTSMYLQQENICDLRRVRIYSSTA